MKPSELKENQFIKLTTEGGTEVVFNREYGMLDMVVQPPMPELPELTNEQYFNPDGSISDLTKEQDKIMDAWESKRVFMRFDSAGFGHCPTEEAADMMYAGMKHWMREIIS